MAEKTRKTEKKDEGVEIDFGMGKVSFGGLFKGLGTLIDLAATAAEKGEELRKMGEIKGLPKEAKGVYGFTVRTLGGAPVVESFGNIRDTPRGPVVEEVREPMVDVFDEKDHVMVVAEMPGVAKEHIHVDVKGKTMTLKADNKERKYLKEVSLPSTVDPATLKFAYKNGILEVKVSKKKATTKH
ncbi:MAG: Hsp20/alpha crystallin family protein [Geobacter sp.]|nr:Hsp20/alpha crystallin family protein [Geobacter sp.]